MGWGHQRSAHSQKALPLACGVVEGLGAQVENILVHSLLFTASIFFLYYLRENERKGNAHECVLYLVVMLDLMGSRWRHYELNGRF